MGFTREILADWNTTIIKVMSRLIPHANANTPNPMAV